MKGIRAWRRRQSAMKIGTGALVIGYPVPYLLAGVILGVNTAYFDNIHTFNQLAEAGLALLFWPLLVLGIDLRF